MNQSLFASLACLLVTVCPAASQAPLDTVSRTTLTVSARDDSGSPVRLVGCELVLDSWYQMTRIPLPLTDQGWVEVPLDTEWLTEKWPDRGEYTTVDARIVVMPEASVVAVSHPFAWLGTPGKTGTGPISSVAVHFPRSDSVSLFRGDSKHLTIVARRASERRLRFIDQTGEPVRGVLASVYLFLSNSNHCGAIEGDRLETVASNYDGLISLPDGDFEYALTIQKPSHVFRETVSSNTHQAILGYLESATSAIELYRVPERDLHIRIHSEGRPLQGIVLNACLARCGCGNCCGVLGTSDPRGRIHLRHFRPELYERLYVDSPSGTLIWAINDKEIQEKPRLDIELPSNSALQRTRPLPDSQ